MIKAGQNFLKTMQWDESEGKTRDDAFYRWSGLWRQRWPAEAFQHCLLHGSLAQHGLPADDRNLQKALVSCHVARNLKSEFNDQAWAGKVNDGGFVYTAAQGGNSMAGKEASGGLRSYASALRYISQGSKA